MSEGIALLGATGSIGRATQEVVRVNADRYHIEAIAGGSRIEPLVEAAKATGARWVVIADEAKKDTLAHALREAGITAQVGAGMADIDAIATDASTPIVVQAIVGAAGVSSTFKTAQAGKKLLLANKESVVCGGALLMQTVKEASATLVPVDSEHSAIFQCLMGEKRRDPGTRLILTASGGPFRQRQDLTNVTPEEAVAHPNWKMGAKISVDSASLMNKGLEVIEARWLFDIDEDHIDVVVHPESIIHSMVEYPDGSVMAQLGVADMKLPIAFALGWPYRLEGNVKHLKITDVGRLTFEEPRRADFPLLNAAFSALKAGGAATIVLNAANEIAVEAFLAHRIGFQALFATVIDALNTLHYEAPTSVEAILAIDAAVRQTVRSRLAARVGA